MNNDPSLEDQLALTLDSMMTTQEALTREREEWAKERSQFLQEMELERVEFGKLRVELGRSVQESAQLSVQHLVVLSATTIAKSLDAELKEHVVQKLASAEAGLVKAAGHGTAVADRLQKLSQDLKVNWKTSLERTFIQVLPTALVLFLIGVLIAVWVQSDADTAKQRMLEWTSAHTKTVQEYKLMKAEMEAWKEAGVDKVRLVPCGGTVPGLCVRVDKKQGASGPNKDLFVPAQP
jgi:hypothetical protein